MFEAMQKNLSELLFFGPSFFAVALILAINLTLTLAHSIQELRGRLWRYFGDIVGIRIPDFLGILLFSFGLTALLWTLGFMGIAGVLPFSGGVTPDVAVAAIGFLIGARLSDGIFSHVRLDRQGYRPNPGLSTAYLYFVEAAVLTILFFPAIQRHFGAAVVGFISGWLLFYLVLPLLRFLTGLFPALRAQA